MSKIMKKRFLQMMLATVLCVFLFSAGAMADGFAKTVYYAKKVVIPKQKSGISDHVYHEINFGEKYPGYQCDSCVSSNPNVIETQPGWYGWFLTKKTGTATLSYVLKNGDKTKKVKVKVKVVPYDNPVKSLKIDGIKVKVNKGWNTASASHAEGTAKATLKLKKNWKVVSVVRTVAEYDPVTYKTVYTVKKYKLKKLAVDDYVVTYRIKLKNKKTKATDVVELDLRKQY